MERFKNKKGNRKEGKKEQKNPKFKISRRIGATYVRVCIELEQTVVAQTTPVVLYCYHTTVLTHEADGIKGRIWNLENGQTVHPCILHRCKQGYASNPQRPLSHTSTAAVAAAAVVAAVIHGTSPDDLTGILCHLPLLSPQILYAQDGETINTIVEYENIVFVIHICRCITALTHSSLSFQLLLQRLCTQQ